MGGGGGRFLRLGQLPFTRLCLHKHEQRPLSFINNTTDSSGSGKRFKMRKIIDLKLHDSLIQSFGSVQSFEMTKVRLDLFKDLKKCSMAFL